jgi:hypothetical protein
MLFVGPFQILDAGVKATDIILVPARPKRSEGGPAGRRWVTCTANETSSFYQSEELI